MNFKPLQTIGMIAPATALALDGKLQLPSAHLRLRTIEVMRDRVLQRIAAQPDGSVSRISVWVNSRRIADLSVTTDGQVPLNDAVILPEDVVLITGPARISVRINGSIAEAEPEPEPEPESPPTKSEQAAAVVAAIASIRKTATQLSDAEINAEISAARAARSQSRKQTSKTKPAPKKKK